MGGAWSLDGYLTEKKAYADSLLKAYLEAIAPRVVERLHDAMAYALLAGGKRLRPTLCLAFAEASAPEADLARAEQAAVALELVHTYSLVHDDLPAMDDDDLRRGKPTCHRVFGEALAILTGDALLTDAFRVLGDGRDTLAAQLCAELASAAGPGGMVGGQVLDIATDRPAEEGYLRRLHGLKTGRLIRAACRMGALAARADPRTLSIAEAYGDCVGLAFQVADDILDVTGDAAALGKATQADAEAGRPTFPHVLGLERSQALARELADRGAAMVGVLGPAAEPLAELARFVVERRS